MFFYEFDVRRCLVYANPNRVAAPSRMLSLVLRIRQEICDAWSMLRREEIGGQCSICTRLRGGVLARAEVDDGHLGSLYRGAHDFVRELYVSLKPRCDCEGSKLTACLAKNKR
jgi:hypothetical protein